MLSQMTSRLYSGSGMLARDARCKTFDSTGDGYGRAEAITTMFLSCNLQNSENIILHCALSNQDGTSSALTAPNGQSQSRIITAAHGNHDFRQFLSVEMHGTGTALGDPIEVGALAALRRGGV